MMLLRDTSDADDFSLNKKYYTTNRCLFFVSEAFQFSAEHGLMGGNTFALVCQKTSKVYLWEKYRLINLKSEVSKSNFTVPTSRFRGLVLYTIKKLKDLAVR